jgi:hypothetical protein
MSASIRRLKFILNVSDELLHLKHEKLTRSGLATAAAETGGNLNLLENLNFLSVAFNPRATRGALMPDSR